MWTSRLTETTDFLDNIFRKSYSFLIKNDLLTSRIRLSMERTCQDVNTFRFQKKKTIFPIKPQLNNDHLFT
jgi:hypothetical protein